MSGSRLRELTHADLSPVRSNLQKIRRATMDIIRFYAIALKKILRFLIVDFFIVIVVCSLAKVIARSIKSFVSASIKYSVSLFNLLVVALRRVTSFFVNCEVQSGSDQYSLEKNNHDFIIDLTGDYPTENRMCLQMKLVERSVIVVPVDGDEFIAVYQFLIFFIFINESFIISENVKLQKFYFYKAFMCWEKDCRLTLASKGCQAIKNNNRELRKEHSVMILNGDVEASSSCALIRGDIGTSENESSAMLLDGDIEVSEIPLSNIEDSCKAGGILKLLVEIENAGESTKVRDVSSVGVVKQYRKKFKKVKRTLKNSIVKIK